MRPRCTALATGYAKTTQEREVWKDVAEDGCPFDAVVLNPSVTLGPAMCKAHTKSSTVLVREVLFGNKMQNFNASYVDVRDVALAASAALQTASAAGKRFIVTGDEGPMNNLDLGPIAQKGLPAYNVGGLPKYYSWQVWLGARLRLL
jgi:nucleoside-diphosphate-sugar epimerase